MSGGRLEMICGWMLCQRSGCSRYGSMPGNGAVIRRLLSAGVQVRKQATEICLPVLQEPAGDLVMLRLFVLDGGDAVEGKVVDERPRIGHQDGRVGGDDELRAVAPGKDAHQPKQRQLPGR